MKINRTKIRDILIISLFSLLLVGCASSSINTSLFSSAGNTIHEGTSGIVLALYHKLWDIFYKEDLQKQFSDSQTTIPLSKSREEISLNDVPAYSGDPYVVINANIPYFSDEDLTTNSFELYSELDELGRCGPACACVGLDLMPTEERGNIGSIKPSGWHTIKYNGIIDGNYLYNRCHLIGYQLSGENTNERNLITGTRYLNVNGMLPFENMVADYVKETGNHVLYRSTPIFDGDNLLASGVLLEAESIEDDGNGVLFCIYAYNVQPSIIINYATGESSLNVNADLESSIEESQEVMPECSTYIINTNTGKFHYPTCKSVKDIKEKNKFEYSGTREEAISMGYIPCKQCNP